MYTQCPDCQTYRSISAKELRTSQATVSCKTCHLKYDALDRLNDGTLPKNIEDQQPYSYIDQMVTTQAKPTPSIPWKSGISICLITLAFQFYYFEFQNLAQNTTYRPWLEKTCQLIPCQLPHYKNLNEISILNGSFEQIDNTSYLFKAAFSNQSEFIQTLPAIKLSLQNFTGQAFAQRTFYPVEYSSHMPYTIKPNLPTEISLLISTPSSPIGGYHFELI